MHYGSEFTVVFLVALTLVVGAAVRGLAPKLRLPYTIAMLLLGIGVGLALRTSGLGDHSLGDMVVSGARISPDLIIFVFLPALVFESAYAIDGHEFRKNLGAVAILAGPALLLSTLMVGLVMMWLMPPSWGWGFTAALVFGALISATDPVAVVAILRELGVSKRLSVLIEGESLLNDGTSIVVFSLLMMLLTGEIKELSFGAAAIEFLRVVVGGLLVGLTLAVIVSKWLEHLFNDPLAEITLTLVLAYSAMIIAEGLLHVSGVMAVVVAGVYMGTVGRTAISPEVEHFLHRFWEMLGYIANTLIFFLVGLVIATQVERASLNDAYLIVVAYVALMLVRFVLTYLSQPLVARLTDGINLKESTIVAWGGLRGAVSLALALIVSQNQTLDVQLRQQILLCTAGAVLLTILINGTTMGKLLAHFGLDQAPLGQQLARLSARQVVLGRVRDSLDEMSDSPDLRTVSWDLVRADLDEQRSRAQAQISKMQRRLENASEEERVAGYWARILCVERQAYWEAFAEGTLSASGVQALGRELDRQMDHLIHGVLEPPLARSPEIRRSLFDTLLGGTRGSFKRMSLLYELARAESFAAERVLTVITTLGDLEASTCRQFESVYAKYQRQAKERIADLRANLPEMATAIERRLARRIELNLEREGFERLGQRGALDEVTVESELMRVEKKMSELRNAATHVEIPETADLVAASALFEGLSAASLARLAEITDERVLSPGAVLFRQGDKGDSLYVIARGAVRILVDCDGKEEVVDVLCGGDIAGEISLLTGAPRSATVVAATSVTLGKITRKAFEELIALEPQLEQKVWQALGRRNLSNLLRSHTHYSRLRRRDRAHWFNSISDHCTSADEQVELQPAAKYLFVISGETVLGGKPCLNQTLIPLGSERQLSSATAARFLVLEAAPMGAEQKTELDLASSAAVRAFQA